MSWLEALAREVSVAARSLRHSPVFATVAVLTLGLGVLVLSRLLTSLLFGVQPGDITTMAIAVESIVGIAALASWFPAWRASRLDPNAILRAA